MIRHFTTSVYLISEEKVLLLFHPKLKKWLPPGGHLEPNESPPEAARREVLEETGLEFEFILQENIWVERWNASSFVRPYLCLIENIPEYGKNPAHQHLDLIYLGRVKGNKKPQSADPIAFFSLDEVKALTSDLEIFAETQEVIGSILTKL